jgi:hypothetical protein
LRNEIATATFDTIDGPVKFDGVQNVSTPTMFLQIQDGRTQIAWPKADAIDQIESERDQSIDRGKDQGCDEKLRREQGVHDSRAEWRRAARRRAAPARQFAQGPLF